MAKYGDCFFRKVSDTKKWEYVDPTRVIGVELNEIGEKIAYHIKPAAAIKVKRPVRKRAWRLLRLKLCCTSQRQMK
jgi:hypothetical protein